MKKVLAFIIVLSLLLTIISSSFADVVKGVVEPYMGMWIGKTSSNSITYIISIGEYPVVDTYVALFLTYKPENNVSTVHYYYLTNDKETNVLYLTQVENEVNYKMKLEDEQLKLFNMYTGDWFITLDKIK